MKKLKLLAIAVLGMCVSSYANEDSLLLVKYKENPNSISNDDKIMLARNYARKDFKLAHHIAQDCIGDLSEQDLLSEKYLTFFVQFTTSSKDENFELIRNHTKEINEAYGSPAFCEEKIANILLKENIPSPVPTTDAGWETVKKELEKKYSAEEADRAISIAKVKYYESQGNWDGYAQASIYRIKKYGVVFNHFDLNNTAFYIFQHCDKPELLTPAYDWMNKQMTTTKSGKDWKEIDTYSNLAYKLGKKDEAIEWEKKAVEFSRSNPEIVENLHKMETNQKTW